MKHVNSMHGTAEVLPTKDLLPARCYKVGESSRTQGCHNPLKGRGETFLAKESLSGFEKSGFFEKISRLGSGLKFAPPPPTPTHPKEGVEPHLGGREKVF